MDILIITQLGKLVFFWNYVKRPDSDKWKSLCSIIQQHCKYYHIDDALRHKSRALQKSLELEKKVF